MNNILQLANQVSKIFLEMHQGHNEIRKLAFFLLDNPKELKKKENRKEEEEEEDLCLHYWDIDSNTWL